MFSLELSNCTAADSGQYTCRVTASGGETATCSANLEIHNLSAAEKKQREESSHPVFVVKLGNADFIKDSMASFMIHCRGNPITDIKIFKDGKPLEATDRHNVYPDTETVALLVTKVCGDDVGTYKTVIHNNLGECSTEAKLVLAGSPQFKEPITDIKTGVDEPYMIIAKVTGAPELTWYKDGVPIPKDPRIKMVKKDAETFELTFQKTAVKDNGNWAVIARNTHGEMSQFFTVAAQMLPKFEAKLQDAEANESKQVVMKCKINCTPRPTSQWFKNGQKITALAPSAIKAYEDQLTS